MTKLYNLEKQKEFRKKLRKIPIGAERKLWQMLRNRNYVHKFRRQYGVGNYIVDFCCPEKKVIVEIDGATHCSEEEIKKDKIRQGFLERLGFRVKRYSNSDVYENIDLVIDNILRACDGGGKRKD